MTLTSKVRDLVEQGDRLFSKRSQWLSLWQTTAENFYPLRADFTNSLQPGQEFASHLFTSKPLYVHRELSNSFSSMLRPRGKTWFRARTHNQQINEDAACRAFLDNMSDAMFTAMYDPHAQFVKTTKQGDADFAAFGQAVISVDPNRDLNGLLYRNWHIRDSAWCENAEGRIDVFHRNWNIEARSYVRLFPKTAADSVKNNLSKEPYKEIKCRHIVIPSDEYEAEKKYNKERFPFVSLYVDIENNILLEETPRKRLGYVLPRWQTIQGWQYAYSPAAALALPDARMLQQISLTILEAGQKAVDPPLKVTSEVVGAVNTYPGGLTWVDAEYDERLGPAIEPIIGGDKSALSWGERKEQQIEQALMDMFYLSKLALPPAEGGDKMTAYEAGQRVEEYIRSTLPLFEPMEVEYNGGLCEETFNLCMDLNLFGPMDGMPEPLKGKDVRWQMDSPLQEALERTKYTAFLQTTNLMQSGLAVDPSIRHDVDVSKAFREAAIGGGAPADWIVPEEQAAQAKAAEAQAAQAQQLAQAVQAGGDIAGSVGAGIQQLQAAGVVPGAA
jgi:hypothetical protein